MVFKFQTAHTVGDALGGILNGMCIVIQGVNAPLIALTMMRCTHDAVNGRVTHIHVGAGQIDLGTQGAAAVREFTSAHTAEQIQVFLGRAVTIRAGAAGLAGIVAAVSTGLFTAQIVHISLACHDQLFGVVVADIKIVAAVKYTAVGVSPQPVQILLNAVYKLHVLVAGVGIVHTQVELATVLLGNAPVDVNGLGTANVQIAVGLMRKTSVNFFHSTRSQIGINDLR